MSPAPQAVPQAAGFSSGLSPAPQAVPQAAAAAVSFFVFHPKRFESAINVTSVSICQKVCPFAIIIVTNYITLKKYAQIYYLVTKK